MKRLMLILLISCTSALMSDAQDSSYPRVTFGAEWSYISSVHSVWHYNFFSPEGYRVNLKGHDFTYISNGEAYLNAGFNLNENLNLSLYLGLAGIRALHNAVPLSLRGTYYFGNDSLLDRWFTFVEAGSGISLKLPPQEIFGCKVGGGYRISLSRHTKLDFLVGLKANYTHPDIIYDEVVIDSERINRNGMVVSSLTFGMAVTL